MCARRPVDATGAARVTSSVRVDGVDYVMVFQELAAIPVTALGPRIASLAAQRVELVAAIGWLLTGA